MPWGFQKVWLTKQPVCKKQNVFKSNKHDIYTAELNKKL